MNRARRRRLVAVAAIIGGVSLAAALAFQALDRNLLFFFSPSQVEAGEAPVDRRFRVGGLVEDGSVQREAGSLAVRFVLTDTATRIPVEYSGLLPNLFREGQGVIAHGRLDPRGVFVADEILARHDENYMAPEVHEALKQGARRPVGEHFPPP